MPNSPKTEPEPEPEIEIGREWINPISGMSYTWDGKVWVSSGEYPYGANPMGLLGDTVG